ncbi:hypothetical protein SAMN05660642_03856 [Geodermatophilus siccatus]|uniref:Uncharacterized protein n=2 Tax=Geodermatophilus siccatus TaxID=1137991 RepID=A0A1G9Y1R0_9ACTN|nr:hypothetical protein SAMN05660642_03856 [Geodermatophilus siccatus]
MQLLTALVPLAVAFIPILRWPTLPRRIREHAALLKDVPEDVAGPLKRTLAAEIEQLARRNWHMLDRRTALYVYFLRAGLVLFIIVVLWGYGVFVPVLYELAPPEDRPSVPLFVWICAIGAVLGFWTVAWVLGRRSRNRRRPFPSGSGE